VSGYTIHVKYVERKWIKSKGKKDENAETLKKLYTHK
jgi:hypothetical protein